MELDNALIKSLKDCRTVDAVEGIFNNSPVKDNDEQRMIYLRRCLGNPTGVYFSGPVKKDEKKEIHSQYLTLLSMFLTRSWSAEK